MLFRTDFFLPVRVQGVEAPPEIVSAIRYANAHKVADLIITGRGGGSIEDLWAFNDERVARAIFVSEIPVISAVGHEPDVTISDFVADLRAATPSNAAELAVPDSSELYEYLNSQTARISSAVNSKISVYRHKIENIASKRVLTSPINYLDDKRQSLDVIQDRLISSYSSNISKFKEIYVEKAAKLDAMSPLKVLGRGYSLATTSDGKIIRRSSDVKSGDKVNLRVQEDTIKCTVD